MNKTLDALLDGTGLCLLWLECLQLREFRGVNGWSRGGHATPSCGTLRTLPGQSVNKTLDALLDGTGLCLLWLECLKLREFRGVNGWSRGGHATPSCGTLRTSPGQSVNKTLDALLYGTGLCLLWLECLQLREFRGVNGWSPGGHATPSCGTLRTSPGQSVNKTLDALLYGTGLCLIWLECLNLREFTGEMGAARVKYKWSTFTWGMLQTSTIQSANLTLLLFMINVY